jgi:hypothetical protein
MAKMMLSWFVLFVVLSFSWVAAETTGIGQLEILMAAGLVAYLGRN